MEPSVKEALTGQCCGNMPDCQHLRMTPKTAFKVLADEIARLSALCEAQGKALSENVGKIIVAMDQGKLSLAKHLLVQAIAFPSAAQEKP